MNLYVDTCVLPRSSLESAELYRERFGQELGFELLMMFDLPDWEDHLRASLSLFSAGPLVFHEPVWGVEHSAPRGSAAWEEGMYHLRLTQKYAEILHPSDMVYHLNNCPVPEGQRDCLLDTSLRNLEEMRGMFPGVRLLVENTGIAAEGTALLNQAEFTDLARDRHWDVLIDVGHANANGWDLYKLVEDLRGRIRGYHLHNNDGVHDRHNRLRDGTVDFGKLLPFLSRTTPAAFRVIEYCREELHGDPLLEDIEYCLHF